MVPAGLVVVLLVVVGCTSSPEPASGSQRRQKVDGPTLHWSRVTLPPGVEPLTLTAAGPGLLVGGHVAAGRVKPRLLRIASDGSSAEVPLVPHSAYSFEAKWRSIVSDGNRVIGVGGAPGGAHSNTRWTTWAGTTAGLKEIPQPFSTFGGWGAGDLLGPVLTSAGPVIAGSWGGAKTGLDAAVWLPAGDRWVRRSSVGTALESTPELLVGPRSATGSGSAVVLSGSALHLAHDKIRQSAAVWRSQRLGDAWARVDLPGSGATGEAVSAQCAGQDCVLAGYVDNALALWRLSTASSARIPGVPHITSSAHTPIPAPLLSGAGIIEAVSAGPNVMVLAGSDKHLTLSLGPVGRATSSALAGGWLYVVVQPAAGPAVLWRCPADVLR